MRLWLDEFAPTCLEELREHSESEPTQLENIARVCLQDKTDVPHLVLHGPNGAGKCLRARLLLSAIYGPAVIKNRRTDVLQLESGQSFNVHGSPYHTEINAAALGFRDRQFVQQMIKELAGLSSTASLTSAKPKCRIFMIHEAHRLTLGAQAALRRTMERHSQTSRIFLLTERLSSIIAPLRSRCVCIAVASPSPPEVDKVLKSVAAQANAKFNKPGVFNEIVGLADGSLRRALALLERSHMRGGSQVELLAWQKCVNNITKTILTKPTVNGALACRSDLHSNIVYNLEGQYFLEQIARGFLKSADLSFVKKVEIAEAAAYFSDLLAEGNQDLYHLEGFLAEAARIIAT